MTEPDPRLAALSQRCPICGRATEAKLRPFCSRRCADVDLGRWFSGQYRTPSLRIDPEEDEENRLHELD